MFITEQRKKTLSLEDAVKVYKEHCSDMDIHSNFIRGRNTTVDFELVDSKDTSRESMSGDHISMYVVDELIKNKYGVGAPQRASATIFTMRRSRTHAAGFGVDLYYIYPFNDTQIAYCEGVDFNYSDRITNRSDLVSRMIGIKPSAIQNYEQIIKELNSVAKSDAINDDDDIVDVDEFEEFMDLYNQFKDGDIDGSEFINELYNLNDIGVDVSDGAYNFKHEKEELELWITGKCLMIHEDSYHDFVDMLEEQ